MPATPFPINETCMNSSFFAVTFWNSRNSLLCRFSACPQNFSWIGLTELEIWAYADTQHSWMNTKLCRTISAHPAVGFGSNFRTGHVYPYHGQCYQKKFRIVMIHKGIRPHSFLRWTLCRLFIFQQIDLKLRESLARTIIYTVLKFLKDPIRRTWAMQ